MPKTKHIYTHPTGCYSLERLFKKKMVQAISKCIVDEHPVFTLHESYTKKRSIERQTGSRWNLSDRDQVILAIELAKKHKDVRLVEEK